MRRESFELSQETRAILMLLIRELDDYLRDPTLSDKEKIIRIEALLYTWITANKLPIWEVEEVDA